MDAGSDMDGDAEESGSFTKTDESLLLLLLFSFMPPESSFVDIDADDVWARCLSTSVSVSLLLSAICLLPSISPRWLLLGVGAGGGRCPTCATSSDLLTDGEGVVLILTDMLDFGCSSIRHAADVGVVVRADLPRPPVGNDGAMQISTDDTRDARRRSTTGPWPSSSP